MSYQPAETSRSARRHGSSEISLSLFEHPVYFVRPMFVEDFSRTFGLVADAGIRSIVLASSMGNTNLQDDSHFRRAREELRVLGLRSPACHGVFGEGRHFSHPQQDGWQAMLDSHISCMTRMHELGCQTYVVHPGPELEGYTRSFLWQRVRLALDILLPLAAKLDMVIALENANPGHLGDDARELAELAAEYASPSLALCFDCGHAHHAGSVLDTCRTMAPFMVTAHLHDNDGTADQHLIPGFGTIPWSALVAELHHCPRLMHLETEAFNTERWEHGKLYRHYVHLLATGNPVEEL